MLCDKYKTDTNQYNHIMALNPWESTKELARCQSASIEVWGPYHKLQRQKMTFDELSPLHAEETQFKNRGDQMEHFQPKPERDTKKVWRQWL